MCVLETLLGILPALEQKQPTPTHTHSHYLLGLVFIFGQRQYWRKVGRIGASMGDSMQELLRKARLGGRQGNLSPMMEAKAWALREVWNDEKESSYGMLEYIAGKVTKVGPADEEPEELSGHEISRGRLGAEDIDDVVSTPGAGFSQKGFLFGVVGTFPKTKGPIFPFDAVTGQGPGRLFDIRL